MTLVLNELFYVYFLLLFLCVVHFFSNLRTVCAILVPFFLKSSQLVTSVIKLSITQLFQCSNQLLL